MTVDCRITTAPHEGADFEAVVAHVRASEHLGFSAHFRSDHYAPTRPHFSGSPGPSDAWMSIAALARETTSIRLGTLVTPISFRHPSVLAIHVAQADRMSHGRVELGLGVGWLEAEHRMWGLPFPPARFALLEEQLAILRGVWGATEELPFTFRGRHYELESARLSPPVQDPIPVVIGGAGRARTPRLAARFAQEYNAGDGDPTETARRIERVKQACEQIGRDPRTMEYSVLSTTIVGGSRREVDRRATAVGEDAESLRRTALAGSPDDIVERVGAYVAAGVTRVYFRTLDISDLEALELLAEGVVPHVRGMGRASHSGERNTCHAG